MLKGIGAPGEQDQETDENGTDGIDEPGHAATNNGHCQAKGIDNDIVAVIDEEDVH